MNVSWVTLRTLSACACLYLHAVLYAKCNVMNAIQQDKTASLDALESTAYIQYSIIASLSDNLSFLDIVTIQNNTVMRVLLTFLPLKYPSNVLLVVHICG